MSELKEHLDTRYVNKREGKEITLPQKYGNGYNPLVLPYTYQNISDDLVANNERAIEAEIAKGLTGHNGLDALNRLRTTSQEFIDDDLKRTFQYDIFKNYEQNLIDNYGGGNWDLTKNPNISSDSITGAGYSVIGNSVLYPQVGLFWNSFYQKYFAVWYTPIRASNNSIISKNNAEKHIRELSNTSSYIQNDTEGIVLRVSKELGFTPADVLSVDTQEPTQQVINTLENIKSWCNLLDEAQKKYFLLKNICDSVNLNKYLFIDEDVNIFSTRQSTYFVFNVTEGYYDDLVEYSGLNKIPEPWSAAKDYEVGDYVLGNSNDGEMKANYIYRCELGYKAKDNDGLFHLKTTKMEKFSNSQIAREITIDRWKIVNTDYAKELEALALVGVSPNNCIRVVLPALEDKAPIDYYPNGLPRPNRQHGVVDWGEPGITLRPVVHKWIKNQEEIDNTPDGQEPPKPKYGTYISYKSILDEGEEDIPTDEVFLTTADNFKAGNKMSSPSNIGVTFIDTSRKLIRYYDKKSLSKKYISVKLEVKLKNIRRESFMNRQDLVKAVCRSAMTGIGYKAFYNCNNLKQVLLPKGLLSIGEQAFAACTSLRRASIPPGVSQLSGCYIGCTNLQSIVLSDNIETLGDGTFMNCTSLEYVYNIKKLKKVGSNTFNNCQSLKEITLPAAITELPSRLFKNCKNAKITLLNNEPTFLGESCFEGCEKITEAVSFANLQQLNSATYKGCTNLKQITFNLPLENEERDIPEKFCYGCTQLKSVDLQNVTSLGNKSFQNCASLTQVNIPSTVVEVGSEVFYDCFRLGKVVIPDSYSLGGSWIEGIINSINRNNWIDPVFTKVVTVSNRVVKWQLTTI